VQSTSLGVSERGGEIFLKGVCINAAVKVYGAAGCEKENRVHINVNGVDNEVVSGGGLQDIVRHSGMPRWPGG
jgi:hypothetical protein